MLDNCSAFKYSPTTQQCVVLQEDEANKASHSGDQVCEKVVLREVASSEAPLFKADEFVEQVEGQIKVGQSIGLYAVGSSSLVWMTWVDQLHMALLRLGYNVPRVPAKWKVEYTPRRVPICDDTKYFQHLKTSRFGRIGWSSWDFALEGWEGCGADGFRMIKDLKVKCQHGAGCAFSKHPMNVSDLSRDASLSNITMLATWFNDDQHWSTHFKCFDGEKKDWHDMLPISIHCLLRQVKSIHAQNPHTWIVIMGKYPETYQHKTFKFLLEYNAKVKEAVEREPKTLFVDFYMPNDHEGVFYQSPAHGGHPNCRGSKIMVHAVIDRLYRARLLARGLALLPPTRENILDAGCEKLSVPACHTSGFCWLDPVLHRCAAYRAGTFEKPQARSA